ENARWYQTDWSWRDYFQGEGNKYGEEKLPHQFVGRTHISQVYKSRTDNLYKFEVVTPLRYRHFEAEALVLGGMAAPLLTEAVPPEIAGVLSVSIDVKNDLFNWLDPDHNAANQDANGKKLKEELVLINDRGCWVYHDGVRPLPDIAQKDPEPYY